MNTIDNLLKILQSAKKEYGGNHLFCVYDRHGEKVDVSGLDVIVKFRGEKDWEELYFI